MVNYRGIFITLGPGGAKQELLSSKSVSKANKSCGSAAALGVTKLTTSRDDFWLHW